MSFSVSARPIAKLGLALAMLLLGTTSRAQLVTTNWAGTADWSSTGNWTSVIGGLHALPLLTDVVGIGSGTATVSDARSVGAIAFSGGTINGAGTLTISDTGSTWTGGTMSGTGSTVVSGTNTLTISGSNTKYLDQRTLTTNGTVTWSGTGGIGGGNGSVFNNNGTFDIQANATWFNQFGGTPTSINNAGTIKRTTGTGTAGLDMAVVTGAGAMDIQTGTLRLSSGVGTSNVGTLSGAVTVASPATLEFAGATYNLTGSLSGAGNLLVSGGVLNSTGALTLSGGMTFAGGSANLSPSTSLTPSAITFSNGTATINVPVTDAGALLISNGTATFNAATSVAGALSFSAGVLGGTGTVTLNGNGNTWTGGTLSGMGSTVVSGTNTLDLSGSNNKYLNQRTLTTNGLVTWSGTGGIGGGGGSVFNNNGTFDIQANTTWFNQFGGTPSAINNAGSITRTVGTGTAALDMAVVSGAGTIAVQTGTLRLSTGISTSNTGALSGGISVAGPGTLEFAGATYNLTGNLSGAGNLVVSGGVFNPTAGLTLSGAMTFSGGTANLSPSTSLTPSAIIVNNGTANFNVPVTDAGTLTISNGTASFNAATSVAGLLAFSAGTLNGTDAITLNGNGNAWTGGTMSGTGSTVITGANTLALSGTNNKYLNQRTLTTNGLVTWSGTGGIGGGGGSVFNNNGAFDIQADATWFNQFGGTPSAINNAGSITRTTGTGTAALDMAVVNGAGSLAVQTGTLRLSNGVSTANIGAMSGGVTVAGPATLEFAGATYNLTGNLGGAGNLVVSGGVFNPTAGLTLSGAMTFSGGTANLSPSTSLTPGAITVNNGTANFNVPVTDAGALAIANGTASFNAATSVAGPLAFSGGTLTGTDAITLNGNGNTWTGGSMSGTGSIVVSGSNTLDLSGSNNKYLNQRTLTTNGLVTWSGTGGIGGGGGSVFNNNGTFDIQTNTTWFNQFGGTPTTINNAGLIKRTSATGTAALDMAVLSGAGALDVETGSLRLSNGVSTSNAGTITGNVSVAGSTTLEFAGATYNLNGTVTSAGNIAVTGGVVNFANPIAGAGTMSITNGTANFTTGLGGIGSLTISGGTLGGAGTATLPAFAQTGGTVAVANLSLTGSITWAAGNWNSTTPSTATIAAGKTLSINDALTNVRDFNFRTITNNGTVNWNSAYLRSGNGGSFINAAGAFFNDFITGNTYSVHNAFGGSFVFANNGTYTKNANGTTYFDTTFNNDGTINLLQGDIQFRQGGTLGSTGTINASAGTTVYFTNDYNVANASSLLGAGTYRLTGGTLTATGVMTVSTFNQTGGTLGGSNSLVGTFNWNGGNWNAPVVVGGTLPMTTIASGTTLNLGDANDGTRDFNFRNVVNNGTVNWTNGHIRSGQGGTFTNAAGANFNDTHSNSGYTIHNPFGGSFVFQNDGTFTRNAAGTAFFDTTFNNNGTLRLLLGDVQIRQGGTMGATSVVNADTGTHLYITNNYTVLDGAQFVGAGLFNQTSGTLTLNGALKAPAFLWSGGNWNVPVEAGQPLPTTTIATGTTLNLNDAIDGTRDFNFRNIVNNGTVNWANGYIRSGQGGTFTNAAGATFNDVHANSGYTINNPFGGAFIFQNDGTYVHDVAATTFFDTTFNNNGTVNVLHGDLQFRQGGTLGSSGTINASAGTNVYFTNDYTIANAASLLGAGTYLLTGGTLTAAGGMNVSTFSQTGGILGGTNSIVGTFNWSGGNWNAPVVAGGSLPTTTLASGSFLNLGDANDGSRDFNFRNIVNHGTVNWTNGYIRSGQGGTFTNAAGATFNDTHTNSGYTINNPYGGSFVFQNDGTYVHNVAATTFFDTTFVNTGLLSLQAGDVQIRGGGTMTASSTVNGAAGTHLYITNSYTLADGAQFTGAGLFDHAGGTLTIDGALQASAFLWSGGNWNASAPPAGSPLATTTIASGTVLNLSDAHDGSRDFNLRNIVNHGTVNWTNGHIRSGQGGTFTNAAGATFNDLHANSGYTVNAAYGGSFVFQNDGTYVHNVAATTFFDTTFVNNGLLSLQAGDVQLRQGGTMNATSIVNAAANTHLYITNNYTLADGAQFTGPGLFDQTAGTLSIDGALKASAFLWSGGNWNAPVVAGGTLPVTSIASSTVLNLSDANDGSRDFNFRNVVNNGTVNWTNGHLRSGQGATFTNAAGATFNDVHANSGYTINNAYGGSFVFQNDGTYVHNVAATTFFDTTFVNNGLLSLQVGDVQFRQGGTMSATSVVNGVAGTNLYFTNNYTLADGAQFTGAGLFDQTGGTLTINGALKASAFLWSGGNWNAPAPVAGAPLATTTIASGTVLNLSDASDGNRDFNSRNIVNNGTVNWTNGHLRSGQGSTFTNAAGATFNDVHANSGYTINNPFGGSFVFQNDGTYDRNVGGTTSVQVPFANTGTVRSQGGGTLAFTSAFTNTGGALIAAGGNFSFASALNVGTGTLGGTGTFTAPSVTAGGLVSPGSPTGVLTIASSLTLLGTSELLFDLGGPTAGTEYDVLNASGTVDLGSSKLSLVFTNGFNSAATSAQTFTLLSSSSLLGSFNNVANGARLVTTDGLGSFLVNYGAGSSFAPNSLVLSNFVAVPEPSTWVLLGLGGMLVALHVGRRRK